MQGKAVTYPELKRRLSRLARQHGTQAALADRLGISAVYLGDVLKGKQAPGPKLLKALGIKRVTLYLITMERAS